jgi:hypothetical protein
MSYQVKTNIFWLSARISLLLVWLVYGIWSYPFMLEYAKNVVKIPFVQVVLPILWTFILVALPVMVVEKIVKGTVTLYLTAKGIECIYWLMFSRKKYPWKDIAGYSQSSRPIKSRSMRWLLKSKQLQTLYIYRTQKEFIALDQTMIAHYDELIEQLTQYPISDLHYSKGRVK